ncbi:hypothetical protein E5161_17790 [Cohnella pontilimi]|uniref:Cthe-2314-like HEPN domain-containing protein n=1 Tax=Cohnella pontilimi TaxID=2564100 RepID=A0A4U0F5A6_9BACL|nr:Cthe_2314 family HEPN domain-containing protein [Cohnella pontilimi]TJY39795.1 hypothetical protein E5161_17790 [Cohnella pontilimi]
MLRSLLGQPPREWDEPLRRTADELNTFIRLCGQRSGGNDSSSMRYRTYAVWAQGLYRSLNELEESLFAARLYGTRIRAARWDDMEREEKLDYDRHVYFDKNAYIRMFSLLDKLGTLVNALLELQTEKIKVYFSFYTVLRQMRETGKHRELTEQLVSLKERHREAMKRLRNRRNMEVHYMNAELEDDLMERLLAGAGDGGRLENLSGNLADAEEGWIMVRDTLGRTFGYLNGQLRGLS